MLDNDMLVGYIAPGSATDIMATGGDLEGVFEKAVEGWPICFVMN